MENRGRKLVNGKKAERVCKLRGDRRHNMELMRWDLLKKEKQNKRGIIRDKGEKNNQE